MSNFEIPVSLENVKFRSRYKTVLKTLSLDVHSNEKILLLGPNGSGKSTLLKIMSGLLKPIGSIKIFGEASYSITAKKLRAYVPQQIDYPSKITVSELIDFIALHYQQKIEKYELLKLYQLNHDEFAANLSSGQKRRLTLALAFIGNPKLLLLDEPEAGLDVEFRESVLNRLLLRNQANNMTIIMASHFFETMTEFFDRVIILNKGQLIFDSNMDQFLKIKNKMQLVKMEDVYRYFVNGV